MSDKDAIIAYAKKFVPLNDSESLEFGDAFKLFRVKKRQFIIQPNFTAKSRYFVIKRYGRSY